MTQWKFDLLLEGSWRGASSVLLRNGRESILVDTGMPHDAHQLLRALDKRELKPAHIRSVINTHFHLDHVSNNFLFPASSIYTTQQSYDWCRALYADLADALSWRKRILKYYPETYEYDKAEERMGKLRGIAVRWWNLSRIGSFSQFRWIERHSLPDGIETLITSGHVPGHASLLVAGAGETTVIAGDALLTRAHDDQVLTMIPYCRAQYHEDRRKILAIPGAIVPGHDRVFVNSPAAQVPLAL